MCRERLRHESDLDQRFSPGLHVRIEDSVNNGPVVHWFARSVFRVGVRRPPLKAGSSVARCQQKMGPDLRWFRAERRKLLNQLAAICAYV